MEEEFGIEKLKEIGVDLAKFGMKVEDALEDKKLSFAEAISLGVFAAPKAIAYAGDAEQIKNEVKDLSQEETEELVSHIADKLDLQHDKIEAVIEAGLEWAAATNKLRLVIKEAV